MPLNSHFKGNGKTGATGLVSVATGDRIERLNINHLYAGIFGQFAIMALGFKSRSLL